MAKHRVSPLHNKRELAYYAFSRPQRLMLLFGLAIAVVILSAAAVTSSLWISASVLVATGTLIMSLRALQTIVVACASANYSYEDSEYSMDDTSLPYYTVLAPVYNEKMNTVTALVKNLGDLDYPENKHEVIILVDKTDTASRDVLSDLEIKYLMPSNMRVLVVEDSIPGKPKALCAGFAQADKSDLICVYDAEDKPDRDQLKKAAAAFLKPGNEKVGCVQARLEFWNRKSTFITHFMWNEYSVHFRRLITGMARLGMIIPLGGTSNHFRTAALKQIADNTPSSNLPENMKEAIKNHLAWDPFNMTEDADLGFVLFQYGWRTLPIDSSTAEEAPLTVKAAFKQRTRWHKGYLQTASVAMRHPISTVRNIGLWRYLNFVVFVGGTPVSLAMLPISLALTSSIVFDKDSTLKQLFPWHLEYGLIAAGGVATFLLLLAIADCINRVAYSSAFIITLLPFWWFMLSAAAIKATWEMRCARTRIAWSHTEHGIDLPDIKPATVPRERRFYRPLKNTARV